ESSGTNLFDGMGRHDGYYTNKNGNSPVVTFGATGSIAGDSDTAVTINPTYGGFGVIPYSPTLAQSRFSIEAFVKTTVTDGNVVPMSDSYGGNGCWAQPRGGYW